jgi:hypothetical protein
MFVEENAMPGNRPGDEQNKSRSDSPVPGAIPEGGYFVPEGVLSGSAGYRFVPKIPEIPKIPKIPEIPESPESLHQRVNRWQTSLPIEDQPMIDSGYPLPPYHNNKESRFIPEEALYDFPSQDVTPKKVPDDEGRGESPNCNLVDAVNERLTEKDKDVPLARDM